MKTYDVATADAPTAVKVIARANKRLEAAGVTERFTYTATPYEKTLADGPLFRKVSRTVFAVTPPKLFLGDYRVLAKVEEAPSGGLMAYTFPGVELHGWRPASMECEHCHKTRKRSRVYVVEDSQGNRTTVGGSCLELYTGFAPEGLWALEWSSLDRYSDPDWEKGTYSYEVSYEKKAALAHGFALIEKYGYRKASYYTGSTRDQIVLLLTAKKLEGDEAFDAPDLLEVAKTVDTATLEADIRTLVGAVDNDWATNLITVLEADFVEDRHLGILASGIWAAVKEKARLAAIAEFEQGYAGPIGSTLATEATVLAHQPLRDETGRTRVVMKSIDGHRLVWNTSSRKLPPVGARIYLEGAVKFTGTFGAMMNTYVSRMKWFERAIEFAKV